MKRLNWVLGILYFSLSLVAFRLIYWQMFNSSFLVAKAEEQRTQVQKILAKRGDIKFQDGTPLALTQTNYSLYALPKIIKDKETFARALSKELMDLNKDQANLDEKTKYDDLKNYELSILEKISKDLYWVSLGKIVSPQDRSKLEKLNLAGLGFEEKLSRFYPEGSSSAHLLGFVGADLYGNDTGYFGVEGYYNGELKGRDGFLTQDKDARGLPILIGNYVKKDPRIGKTFILNIDRTIQYIVEKQLKQSIVSYGAKGASAIVMNPKTGAVLALASYPNYDPARIGEFPTEYYRNPITIDTYEPGSTFKVLVMAAALNENVVSPETICDNCSGPINIGGFNLRTWNNKYQDKLTMIDTIIHSDNIGMVFVAKKLGVDKMYDYIQKFRIGSLTNIDLQDEYSPTLRGKSLWKEIDLATASFGQGISVTALQVVRAIAAIANNGILMEPHVVKSISDEKNTYNIPPKEVDRPISKETAKKITDMMVGAVDEGEAKFFKPKGYKIAGKTGTAQIPVSGHYDPNKTIASFVGFAPADDPQFIMFVRFDEPSASIYGAETAAPTFFEISKEIFKYYRIMPNN